MKITRITTYRAAPRWMLLKMETAVAEFADLLVGQDPRSINGSFRINVRGSNKAALGMDFQNARLYN